MPWRRTPVIARCDVDVHRGDTPGTPATAVENERENERELLAAILRAIARQCQRTSPPD